MIGRLVGKIVEEEVDGTLVIDVSGVGYEVHAPLGTLGRLGVSALAKEGAAKEEGVTLSIHTHVREDALILYGFSSRDEREAFRTLISVSNVGPKIAMAILGAMTVNELADAVQRGDVKRFVGVPGVGKKTGERLVLELKDKIIAPHGAVAHAVKHAAAPAPPTEKGELLRGALTRMGYRPSEADRAVSGLGTRVDELPLADLVREALALLSR